MNNSLNISGRRANTGTLVTLLLFSALAASTVCLGQEDKPSENNQLTKIEGKYHEQ
jgi:hypothetical protein